jgi:hypothetical protein
MLHHGMQMIGDVKRRRFGNDTGLNEIEVTRLVGRYP